MKIGKKSLGILLVVVVLAGGGTVLFRTGKLPFIPGSTVAAADSTAAADTLALKKDKDGKEIMPIPVELARAEARGIAAYYRAASVVEADRLVDLVAKVPGRIHTVQVEEGDWVERGAVLAEFENERERIQLRKAELTLADKQRLLARTEGMLAEELISRQEFDDVESTCRLAEAERDLAAINLEDTRIRAPFAGLVTDRKVVAGQQMPAAAAAFTLGDFSPLRVRVHLPEAIARKVEEGQRVLVAPEAVETELEAVVERISPVVDPATSTVRLTLLLDEDSEAMRVGAFVKVRITTDRRHDALAVPKLALVEEGALRSVFVAAADTVRKVEVETGLYDETHVEVLEGVQAGDFVVTMGQGGLRNGTVIKVLNATEVGYQAADTSETDPARDGDGSLVAKAD